MRWNDKEGNRVIRPCYIRPLAGWWMDFGCEGWEGEDPCVFVCMRRCRLFNLIIKKVSLKTVRGMDGCIGTEVVNHIHIRVCIIHGIGFWGF